MNLIRILLFPFSIIYGIVVWLRNKIYDLEVVKPIKFDIPVISIGNLKVGGTGKTPHIEYLINFLKNNYKVGVLSRGYKRKTSGYLFLGDQINALRYGDEPCQIKYKFPQVSVAVCEKRIIGIPSLLLDDPEVNLILLDDAFQHRAVKPSLSILLIEFNDLFLRNLLFPAGKYREYSSAKKRADIIVITKIPENFSTNEKELALKKLKPHKHHHVYFSFIKYRNLHSLNTADKYLPELDKNISVLLFCGIANPDPLKQYLENKVKEVILVKYNDHHCFTKNDFKKIKNIFEEIVNMEKFILTTEKDLMRLKEPSLSDIINDLPVFYIPIEIDIWEESEKFNSAISQHLENFVNDK